MDHHVLRFRRGITSACRRLEIVYAPSSVGGHGGITHGRINLATVRRKADRAHLAVGRQASQLTGSPRPPGRGGSAKS